MSSRKIVTVTTLAALLSISGIAVSQAQNPSQLKPVVKEATPAVRASQPTAEPNGGGAKVSQEGSDPADAPNQKAFVKQALTWQVQKTQVLGGKTYVLMSHDYGTSGHVSNPYQGDTGINQRRSLLCIKKSQQPTPAPTGLTPLNVMTPGGAMSKSWSSATMFAIPNILGSDLTSRAVADSKCNTVGQVIYGTSGYRMAEFHDGQANSNAGWSYWTEGYSVRQGLDASPMALYWVAINNQPANPW